MLKIKNIRLKEQYGEGDIPYQAKAGSGQMMLTCSFPYVRDWLNEHPFKNSPEASLLGIRWCIIWLIGLAIFLPFIIVLQFERMYKLSSFFKRSKIPIFRCYITSAKPITHSFPLVFVYVPMTSHKVVLKNYKGKQVKVILGDAL
jgi:hypothetical protein